MIISLSIAMEEVDTIILQSLREIGCDLDESAQLKSLSPEDIYKCIGKLCKTIKPDVEISSHLPAQVAQRFSAASQLVDCCKSIGFNGDLGYQTILYSNPIELRRIFMWLIEHLPKSEDKTDSYIQSKDVNEAKAIEAAILRKLATDLKRPWILEFLQSPPNIKSDPVDLEKPDVTMSMSEGKLGELIDTYMPLTSLLIYSQICGSINESLSQRFSIKRDPC